MFAPDLTTHQLADSVHAGRQAHAALLHKVARDRADGSMTVDRQAHRRATARRLVATLAGAILSLRPTRRAVA